MARMRTLKPEFFRDKKIAALGPTAALVYEALWCLADDGGVAPGDPERVWGEMFVRWPDVLCEDVHRAMVALHESSRVQIYQLGDECWAEIPRFTDHQKPNNPSKHRNPRPTKDITPVAPQWLREPYRSPTLQLSGISSQVSGNRRTTGSSRAQKKSRGEAQPNWVTSCTDLWHELAGAIPAGRLGRALKPVHTALGTEATLQTLRGWLAAGQAKYGPENFARSYRDYLPIEPYLANGDANPAFLRAMAESRPK